jgi:ABC-type multidrug transport system fused ATPase/permease subunit/CRP-like cAMP-binding protein
MGAPDCPHVPRRPGFRDASLFGGGGQFSSLLRWYRPNLKGSGRLLSFTLAATAVVLVCQAVIPLQVHNLLEAGVKDLPGIAMLVGLVVLQLIAAYLSHLGAADTANDSSYRLRLRIFEALLHTKVLRQEGLVRSSVVSRHTSDVDHIDDAFEQTIGQGIPGVIRVIQSLILLTFIDWRAGLVMTIAVILFVLIRRLVGTQLLVIDRARLGASSRVGESVDEAITASRLISGLHLESWAQARFQTRAERLRLTTHQQVHRVTQLFTGAQAAGLAGLVAVVVFGLFIGGGGLATVAAALLYVEGVVRGLEALPGWIRSLQMAVVSRRRIDQILNPREEVDEAPMILGSAIADRLTSAIIDAPVGSIVGLVTTPGLDPDAVLTALSAGSHSDSWRVTLEGHDIRRPGVMPEVLHISADTVAFNDSVAAHLRAADANLGVEDISRLLDSVGLGRLVDSPLGLERSLGPTGAALSGHERQRLALALGLAAEPRVLLVGPIIALSDADAAMPLLATLRGASMGLSVVAVRSPDIVPAMDAMLFVSEDVVAFGSHSELLVSTPSYSRLWEKRLAVGGVDLGVLGLEGVDENSLEARLVTERYESGEAIYRQGEAADRVVFIISGHVEMGTEGSDGKRRRVAVLGPGNHCGDLRLTVGEQRAESAYAMDVCIVRSLSREAVSAGLTGLLDRTPTERRIVSSLLRTGPADVPELAVRLGDLSADDITGAVASLERDGALRSADGRLSVVMKRSSRKGASDLLDRLSGL